MKIGRSQDYLSLALTEEEYKRFHKIAPSYDDRLRCQIKLAPTEESVFVTFGDGRVLSRDKGGVYRVAFVAENVRAGRLPKFGLTSSRYHTGATPNKIFIEVPTVRPSPRRHFSEPRVSETFVREPIREAPPVRSAHVAVTDDELITAKHVYNRAIEQGYAPRVDGRGRILWFDRQAASE